MHTEHDDLYAGPYHQGPARLLPILISASDDVPEPRRELTIRAERASWVVVCCLAVAEAEGLVVAISGR